MWVPTSMSEQAFDSPNYREQAENYRQLSDELTVGYRRAGIIDSDQTELLLADPDTAYATTNHGILPAFTPIEHAIGAGYDVQRSHELIGDDQKAAAIFYYCLPPLGRDSIVAAEVPNVTEGYVYLDHASADSETPEVLVSMLRQNNCEVEEVPILDDQAALGNEQASISLYGFHNPTADMSKHVTLHDVSEEYNRGIAEGTYPNTEDGARLYSGDRLDPELTELLWNMYQDRFQWLGEKHPISMEDTKAEFIGLLTAPTTVASIYFEAGKPNCFAYFTDELTNIYWLNSDFTTGSRMGLEAGEKPLFWPGIVARPENVLNYAEPVIQLVTKVITDMHAPYQIVFENTNRSEVYIPTLVKKYIDGTGVIIEQPALIDRQLYRCFKFTKRAGES